MSLKYMIQILPLFIEGIRHKTHNVVDHTPVGPDEILRPIYLAWSGLMQNRQS